MRILYAGISRKIDELGRIAIPSEIRNVLGIREKDSLSIKIMERKIILEKEHIDCSLCHAENNLKEYHDKFICSDCIERIKSL